MNTPFDKRLPDKMTQKIIAMQDEIIRSRGTGLVTRSQAEKLDKALDKFVRDANEAMKMFDNISRRSKPVEPYNGGRNMEADRHEDDGMD